MLLFHCFEAFFHCFKKFLPRNFYMKLYSTAFACYVSFSANKVQQKWKNLFHFHCVWSWQTSLSPVTASLSLKLNQTKTMAGNILVIRKITSIYNGMFWGEGGLGYLEYAQWTFCMKESFCMQPPTKFKKVAYTRLTSDWKVCRVHGGSLLHRKCWYG